MENVKYYIEEYLIFFSFDNIKAFFINNFSIPLSSAAKVCKGNDEKSIATDNSKVNILFFILSTLLFWTTLFFYDTLIIVLSFFNITRTIIPKTKHTAQHIKLNLKGSKLCKLQAK